MKPFIHPSVSSAALSRFWERLNATGTEMHCLNIRLKDQPLVRWSSAPYECTDKRLLYSLSKSFCSTAAGIAFDKGLLHPDDAVLKYFPEYADACSADARWQRMKLRHVMSMNTGHANGVYQQMLRSEDSVQPFFTSPLTYEPGSYFVYNTGATCLLAEVVRRVTGMTVPQWLSIHLFGELGIDSFEWAQCRDGHCQGGTGLYLSCDDLVLLGQLYLNEGMWQDKRLLSREWVQMATAAHSDNSVTGHPGPDWNAGYGFQFWRNHRMGYRGDGAYGQLLVMVPEKQIVVALQAESKHMQAEMDAVFALLDELFGTEQAKLPEGYVPNGTLDGRELDTGWRTLAPNCYDLRSLRLKIDPSGAKLWLADDTHTECLIAPSGKWRENCLHFIAGIEGAKRPVTLRLSAAARTEGETVIIEWRQRNTPHACDWKITFDSEGKLHMKRFSPMGVPNDFEVLDEQ